MEEIIFFQFSLLSDQYFGLLVWNFPIEQKLVCHLVDCDVAVLLYFFGVIIQVTNGQPCFPTNVGHVYSFNQFFRALSLLFLELVNQGYPCGDNIFQERISLKHLLVFFVFGCQHRNEPWYVTSSLSLRYILHGSIVQCIHQEIIILWGSIDISQFFYQGLQRNFSI